jgi:hypothetical protein
MTTALKASVFTALPLPKDCNAPPLLGTDCASGSNADALRAVPGIGSQRAADPIKRASEEHPQP